MLSEDIPASLLPLLEKLPSIDLRPFRKQMGLAHDRIELLADVVSLKKELYYYIFLDINLFCLKMVFPDEYRAAGVSGHPGSSSDLFEYDPVKNGQNIIKHGICFSEAATLSNNFGALMVPCPDESDGERVVIFSDLMLGNKRELSLPPTGMDLTIKMCTLSVAQNRNNRFRFISSRILNCHNYRKQMAQSFRGIYENAPKDKEGFMGRCSEIIEGCLFGDMSHPARLTPIRIVRPAPKATPDPEQPPAF